jgi:hypothetical protein
MNEKRGNMKAWIGCCLSILIAIVGGGAATIVSAQSPVVVLGQPYQVAFDHDGQNVTHFRVLLTAPGATDETQVGPDYATSTVLTNGTAAVTMPALSVRGSYRVRIAARNVDPQGLATPGQTYSAFLEFTAEPPSMTPPAVPSNLRIIRVTVEILR